MWRVMNYEVEYLLAFDIKESNLAFHLARKCNFENEIIALFKLQPDLKAL